MVKLSTWASTSARHATLPSSNATTSTSQFFDLKSVSVVASASKGAETVLNAIAAAKPNQVFMTIPFSQFFSRVVQRGLFCKQKIVSPRVPVPFETARKVRPPIPTLAKIAQARAQWPNLPLRRFWSIAPPIRAFCPLSPSRHGQAIQLHAKPRHKCA